MSDVGTKWLGVFQDSHVGENSVEYGLRAGQPKETAEKLGTSLSIFIFARDNDEFLLTVVSPVAARVNTLRFKLNEKTRVTRKHGTLMTSLYEWHEAERTLFTFFNPEDGDPFEMHFSFDESYQSIHRCSKTGPIVSRTTMHRLA